MDASRPLRSAWAIAAKDLRLLWRDRAGAALALVWPLVIAVFVGGFAPGLPGRDQPSPDGLTPFMVTFPQGMLWGVIACAATFGIGLVDERRAGTLARLHVAPIRPYTVMVGKTLACLVAALAVESVVLAVGVAGFGVRPNSWALLVGAMSSVAVGLCGLTTLVAVAARTARSASGLTWVVLMSLALIGGAMIPLATMPPPMQQVAHLSPVAWGIYALEGAMWRDWTWLEAAPYLGASWALGLTSLGIGAAVFRPS